MEIIRYGILCLHRRVRKDLARFYCRIDQLIKTISIWIVFWCTYILCDFKIYQYESTNTYGLQTNDN